jgi:hypothetical protein
VGSWSFLTNHARVLLCIAHDPGVRLRDIAASAGITERSAYGIVTDLTTAGYVTKEKDGRRNRYQIQPHMPLPEPGGQGTAIGEVLAVLAGAGQPVTRPAPAPDGRQQYHEAGGRSRPEFAAPPVVAERAPDADPGRGYGPAPPMANKDDHGPRSSARRPPWDRTGIDWGAPARY